MLNLHIIHLNNKKLIQNFFLQTWQRRKHLPQTVWLQLIQCLAPVEDQLVPHQDGGWVQHWQRRDPLLHPLQLRHQQDEQGTLRPLQLHDEHLWEVNNGFCFSLSNKRKKKKYEDLKRISRTSSRYPLIDGTFFLSPRQHTTSCIPVDFQNMIFIKFGFQTKRAKLYCSFLRWSQRGANATCLQFAWAASRGGPPGFSVGISNASSCGTEASSSWGRCTPTTSLLPSPAVQTDSR